MKYYEQIRAGIKSMDWPHSYDAVGVNAFVDTMRRKAVKEFRISGQIQPRFFLLTNYSPVDPNHGPAIVHVPFMHSNIEEKMKFYAAIRTMADVTRASAVFSVSEVWMSEFAFGDPSKVEERYKEFKRIYGQPEFDPNRKECVIVTCQSLFLPAVRAEHAMIFRPRKATPYLGPFIAFPEGGGDLFNLIPYLRKTAAYD